MAIAGIPADPQPDKPISASWFARFLAWARQVDPVKGRLLMPVPLPGGGTTWEFCDPNFERKLATGGTWPFKFYPFGDSQIYVNGADGAVPYVNNEEATIGGVNCTDPSLPKLAAGANGKVWVLQRFIGYGTNGPPEIGFGNTVPDNTVTEAYRVLGKIVNGVPAWGVRHTLQVIKCRGANYAWGVG